MLPQLIDNLCYVAFVGVICLRSLVAGLCRIQICDGRSFSWEESLLPLSLEEEEAQRRRMRVGNTAPQKKKKSLSELTKSSAGKKHEDAAPSHPRPRNVRPPLATILRT
ncbi:unnamed protein product [Linum tenue]|uniref:Uncharacterized protein n=1 Tax=Linum tenue TaxID=586396 RepID=A0AAV0J4F6_9ROSI|nr:unnamed protein product [Linum tenue]